MIKQLPEIPIVRQKVQQVELVRTFLIMEMLFVSSEVFIYAIFAPQKPIKKNVRKVNG